MDVKMNKAASAYNSAASAYNSIAKMDVDKMPGMDTISGGDMKPDFTELLGEALNKAIATEYKSESISAKALVNQAELTDLVTAMTNAELTLNTVVAMRDKVISAYNDIVKMPI